MADWKFVADFTDLQTMRRELVGVAKDAKQSAGVFEREYRKVERQLEQSAKANQQFFNDTLKVGRASKDAAKSAEVFAKDLQRQEQATARYNKETERLKLQYNSTYRAAKLFKTQLRELGEAHARGAISADRHEQQVRELKNEYRAFLKNGGGPMNQFGQIASKNTRIMKRFGAVGVQQVGYQVQDFAVQVQSGTSVLVALGQQGSQLLGIFGPAGAIAGMILAIGTGLAGAFLAAKNASDASAESVKIFAEAAERASEKTAMFEAKVKALQLGFDDLTRAAKAASLAEATAELTRLEQSLQTATSGRGGGARRVILERIQEQKELVRSLTEENNQLDKAASTEQFLLNLKGDQVLEAENLRANAERERRERVAALQDHSKSEQRAIDQGFSKEAQLMAQNAAISSENAKRSIDQIKAQERAIDQRFSKEAQLMAQNVAISSENAERSIAQIKAQEGAIDQRFSKEAQLMAQSVEISGETEKTLRAYEKLVGEIGEGATQALLLAGVDITSGIDAAAKAAGRLSDRMGIAVEAALAIINIESGMKQQSGPRRESGRTLPQVTANVSGSLGEDYRRSMKIGEFAPETFGGGGGGGVDPVEELKRAQDAVDQLRASYDEQYATSLQVAEAQEKVNELIRLNPELSGEANKVLQDYIASLEQADSVMVDFVNDSAQQMADAFASIIDGSKSASDAFRDMARSILEEALRMAVINPIINSIFGSVPGFSALPSFFPNANGNAFSNGNVIPFANGGVVSSPTMFPMAGSQTGLMGEAGPEAIMPLKRGKGGKLGVVAEGASQPVVIHQSFNFSANGDDSVKRIIAQEAPKIANMTQRQILDQRARGGAFKTTFG